MNKICERVRTPCVLRRWQMRVVLLAALVAVGCSDDDDPSTVERADITSTTAAATTTAEAAPTTTLAPCSPLEAPIAPSDMISEAEGDVDGDGKPDVLVSHRVQGDTFHIEARLARGGGVLLELQVFGGPVGVIGGADIDDDGDDEIWARTGAGASTTIVSAFAVDGCDLLPVAFEGGARADFPVGGSVGTTSGVECDDQGALRAFTASYVGDGSDDVYELTTVTYGLDGATLVEQERETSEVAANDPDFVRYTSFSCGDLVL